VNEGPDRGYLLRRSPLLGYSPLTGAADGCQRPLGRVLKAGFAEDLPFTGQGDIPTRESWSAANLGFVGGLAVDSRVYDSLIKTFANR
jgi:hypothetical protein